MRTEQFKSWLRNVRDHSERSIGSRISNCKRLESYEGDLDQHFEQDGMVGLLDRLSYSATDERNHKPPLHGIPITGNMYDGTATLRSAATLYRDFREDQLCAPVAGHPSGQSMDELEAASKAALASNPMSYANPLRRQRGEDGVRGDWPTWDQPADKDILQLAKVMTPLVKFLHPDIVAAVAQDNRHHSHAWRAALNDRGVDPDIYLWRSSPCAFPGFRRYAGSQEIAWFRKRTRDTDFSPPNCLRLDDNDYPKHLWAFILTGTQFRKRGPQGYQLAHLADHKDHNNRWSQDFGVEAPGVPPPLFGLYTSPANVVFVPKSFLAPTDLVGTIRALLLSKAFDLYSDACRLAPPPLVKKEAPVDSRWHPNEFEWGEPVGEIANLPRFLDFRREEIEKALE